MTERHRRSPRPSSSALVSRVPPLLRPGHRHRPDLARRWRRRGYGHGGRQLRVLAALGIRDRDCFPVPVRFAHRALSALQPARRGSARRAGPAASAVRADPVRRRRGHGARLRVVHDGWRWRDMPQRVWIRSRLAVGDRLQRDRVVSGLSIRLSAARDRLLLFPGGPVGVVSRLCDLGRIRSRRSGARSVSRGDAGEAGTSTIPATSRWR